MTTHQRPEPEVDKTSAAPGATTPQPAAPPAVLRKFYGLSIGTGLTTGLTAPLTAILAVDLGASPFAASVSVASLSMVVLVLDIVGTRFLPFVEPRRAIAAGMLLWAIGSIGTAVAPTFELMAAARLIQGVGIAFHGAAAPQLAVKLIGRGRVGTAVGRFQAATTLGSAIAPLTGGAITGISPGEMGLRLAFAVCGLFALACSIAAWVMLPTMRSATKPRWSLPRLPGMGHVRPMLSLWMAAAGPGTRGALALTVIPLIAAARLDLDGAGLGAFLTAMYLVEVATMSTIGALSDRTGRRRWVLLATLIGVVGIGVVALAVVTGSLVLFYTAVLPLGIAGGCMFSVVPAALVDLAGTPEVGLTATRIARDLGMSSFTVLAGAAISLADVRGGLWICCAMYASVAVIMIIVGETRERPKPAVATD